MKSFALRRVRQNDFATYGRLSDESEAQIAVTLEPPNSGAHPCIPAGLYPLRRRWSAKHNRDVFGVEDVPGRDNIEIHPGDLPCDTDGCILPGQSFGYVEYPDHRPNGKGYGVTASHAAFERFMNLLDGENEAQLVVHDVAPAIA